MTTKINKGFTIVEVLIVIAVVAILSSLAIVSYTGVRQDSRDADRETNATVISEALEKYYERNGEYPSVPSIVNDWPANTGPVVAQKLSIPPGTLLMPNMPSSATNALTSGPEPNNDFIVYAGQSAEDNERCQSDPSGGCDEYALVYQEEATGNTKTVESRRSTRSNLTKPDLSVSTTGPSSIAATWSAIPEATAYSLQYSTSPSLSSPITTAHTSTSTTVTGLQSDTEYYFRVQAIISGSTSEWSDIQSDTTSNITVPSGTITITAAMSGTNARGTAGGGTCAAGSTIERQIRYRINGGSWVTWSTTSQRDVAATEGYLYTFQAQARCKSGNINSPWAQSATADVTRPVTAPSGLTATAVMSGSNARGTAVGGACASGTTLERRMQYQVNGGSWTPWVNGGILEVAASQGASYTFRQSARCVGQHNSSDWIVGSTASVTRPLPTPGAPGLSVSTSGSITTWTATNTCPAGTTPIYERTSLQQGGSWSGWTGASTSNSSTWNTSAQGYTYYRAYRIRCSNAYGTSAWSAQSPTRSYTRPVSVPAASGWTHVSLGWQHESNCKYYSGCKWRRYTWTPPTCPAGTTYHSSRWNSYVGPKMSWDNGRSQVYRWWHGSSTGSTTTDSVAYASPQNSHIIEYAYNVPANYDDVKHKLIWSCRNPVTGVIGTTEMHSPTYRYM